DLARCRAVGPGDLLQDAAALAAWPREIAGAERAVGDDRHAMTLAPRDDRMLDRPLLQVIEHLIAPDAARPGDLQRGVQVADVEVAHAPRADLTRALQLLER